MPASHDPYERVSDLLRVATDPSKPLPERREAAGELGEISQRELELLNLDSEWRRLLEALAPPVEPDSSDPWTAAWEEDAASEDPFSLVPPTNPSPESLCRSSFPIVAVYDRDLRGLLLNDMGANPHLWDEVPELDSPDAPEALVARSGMGLHADDQDVVAALAASFLNPGFALNYVRDRWPDDRVLLGTCIHEALRVGVVSPLPPHLLVDFQGTLSALREDRVAWYRRVRNAGIAQLMGTDDWSLLDGKALEQALLDLRVLVARAARQTEMLDPTPVRLAELDLTVRLLRAVGRADVWAAYREGRGDSGIVASRYAELDEARGLRFEAALQVALCQPAPALIQALSAADREALRYVRAIREREALRAMERARSPREDLG